MTLACDTSAGEKEKIVASEQSPVEENRPEDEFSFIDQSQAPDRLPIFPLPNVLLFRTWSCRCTSSRNATNAW